MSNMPLIFENSVLKNNAYKIIEYIDSHNEDFGALNSNNYWEGRTIHIPQIKDTNIITILKDYKNELVSKFHALSGISKKIYPDSLHLVRWPINYELLPHADAENPNGQPHEFSWRNFGTVGFLNENFDGGDLYLPNKNLTIKAQTGYSVIFPGTLEYLHGVSKIAKGTRYTIASFLTYDSNHEYKI